MSVSERERPLLAARAAANVADVAYSCGIGTPCSPSGAVGTNANHVCDVTDHNAANGPIIIVARNHGIGQSLLMLPADVLGTGLARLSVPSVELASPSVKAELGIFVGQHLRL